MHANVAQIRCQFARENRDSNCSALFFLVAFPVTQIRQENSLSGEGRVQRNN